MDTYVVFVYFIMSLSLKWIRVLIHNVFINW